MAVDLTRINVRPFKLSDVDDVMLWAGDDQVTQNTRLKTIRSREEALTFTRDVCMPHPWHRSICIDDRCIRLEALADSHNMASQRVLEKAGFLREALLRNYAIVKGIVRDVVVYSFLSSDTSSPPHPTLC